MRTMLLFILALFSLSTSTSAIAITDRYTGGVTEAEMVNSFVGSGIQIDDFSMITTPVSSGLYSDATVLAQGNENLLSGVILSTGYIGDLGDVNTSDEMSGVLNAAAFSTMSYSDALEYLYFEDEDLQELTGTSNVNDYNIINIDFTATMSGTATFDYLFGSDEYDEYVDQYNDAFGFFLDGENIALLPETGEPISINTVNVGDNADYYNDNDLTAFPGGVPYATEMDGFTTPLSVSFNVTEGEQYHLKLGIADARDYLWDSWLLLGENSFTIVEQPPLTVPEPCSILLLLTGILLLAGTQLFKRNRT